MSAESALKSLINVCAGKKEYVKNTLSQGQLLWSIVDGAADQTFENYIKGFDLTYLDNALIEGRIGSIKEFGAVLQSINTYLQSAGITDTPLLEGYLKTVGWRIPQSFADLFAECLGTGYKINTRYVSPKGIIPLASADPTNSGMHEFISIADTVETVEDGALDSNSILVSAILAINTDATASTGDFSGELVSGNEKVISASLTSQYEQEILGGSSITLVNGNAITVSSATNFDIGEYVLIRSMDGLNVLCEVAKITNKVGSVLTLDSSVKINHVDPVAYPMFKDVRYSANGSGSINVYAYPESKISV